MSTPRDDDALSWGGDDDPTLDVGEKAAPERATRGASPPDPAPREARSPEPLQPAPAPLQPRSSSAEPVSRHPEAVDIESEDDEPDAAHQRPLGNAGLIGIGMVAATFLLFAVGWLVAGFRLQGLGLPIPSVTLIALTIGAALAPLVWFVAVLALTRSWRTWQRFLLLILGIVLLVPWPFLSLGAFA
ncbi:DNA polymerase III subunit gamma/tau [Microbacterium sp. lyk4-40-TSB-66]|uniref:DNA polymerase III subunit gamma/tau n=1 Tax=Microbacterium sp. lyk4-40-TSB-66 TaxID=3040294 RepID=UPI0025505A2F|nr:DNA polymerase III subunit gamma/tau [Microbacterium sp. lyk4-40-TSB-66]